MKKKILKIVSIMTLSLVMIISMCSFTTTYSENYKIYESQTQIDLSYNYGGPTEGLYQGTIPACNRVLIDANASSVSAMKSSMKFSNCDLLMTGTHSIDIRSFSVSKNPSILYKDSDGYYYLGLVYCADNKQYVRIGTKFEFWNYHPEDFIVLTLYDYVGDPYGSDYENFYADLSVELLTYDSSTGSIVQNTYTRSDTLAELYEYYHPGISEVNCISLSDLVYSLLVRNGLDPEDGYVCGKDYLINRVSLNITRPNDQDDFEPGVPVKGYGAVKVGAYIYEKQADGLDSSSLAFFNNIFSGYKETVKNLRQDIADAVTGLKVKDKTIKEQEERIQELAANMNNADALPLFFDGLYKVVYNTLTIFFNMDFFGAKLGSIVGILLGAAIVILILKVVL